MDIASQRCSEAEERAYYYTIAIKKNNSLVFRDDLDASLEMNLL